MKPLLHIAANVAELSRTAATEFVRRANEAVQAQGGFTVSLSGGSTPKSLYTLLADDASLRAAVP
jgi:6-phosphogluconolactonase